MSEAKSPHFKPLYAPTRSHPLWQVFWYCYLLAGPGVKDFPYRICCPWVRGGWGLDALGISSVATVTHPRGDCKIIMKGCCRMKGDWLYYIILCYILYSPLLYPHVLSLLWLTLKLWHTHTHTTEGEHSSATGDLDPAPNPNLRCLSSGQPLGWVVVECMEKSVQGR